LKAVSFLSDVPYTTAYWDIPPQLQRSTETRRPTACCLQNYFKIQILLQ